MEMSNYTELETGGAEFTIELNAEEIQLLVNIGINTILDRHLTELENDD